MHREKATHVEDLPHQFAANVAEGSTCDVCHGGKWDARHLAFEKAAEHPTVPSDLPRERGA